MTNPLVVILGAGRPFSGTQPAPLQRVSDNRRTLDWIIDAFTRALDDPEIHFVGGYRLDEVLEEYPDIHFSRNTDWEETGTIGTLLSAPFNENRPTYVCYGDVVFHPDIVESTTETQTGTQVVVDEQWQTRYQSRTPQSRERAEKVRYGTGEDGNSYVDRVSTDIDPNDADAEFTGLTRLSSDALKLFYDLIDRGLLTPEDGLADFLTALKIGDINPKPVNIQGHWAELETAEDIARFVLDTKANTLKRLEPIVTESTIAPQYTFTVSEFEADPDEVYTNVTKSFDCPVIVRSSTLAEDGWEDSNAGRFESVLNVPPEDESRFMDAVNRVIDSYTDNVENQVLVQPMIEDVVASGVVMTRSIEHASPYYIINYDAETGSTVTVTDGSGDDIRTIVVRKDAIGHLDNLGDSGLYLLSLIQAITELEDVVGHDSLDIEFAITTSGEVYVLQVRPMTVDPGEHTIDDETIYQQLEQARHEFLNRRSTSPFVLGDHSIYGVMPDWNPAEIIGRNPRLLAESLYRYLITDDIWATQRSEFGYRDVRPHPLMISFAGLPFIDVRADFNSFIPASVSDNLAQKLVNYYLERLESNPELHDKIEFEIALTCLPFDFDYRARPLRETGFSEQELTELEEGLREITQGAFERVKRGVDMKEIDQLEERFYRIDQTDMSHLQRVRILLEDCRRLGTLPFAHLARAAFVSVSLLRSLERKGIITDTQHTRFLNSLETIARKFEHDGYRVSTGELDFEAFVDRYGHLRPGTYDITSPCYAADPETYLRPVVETATQPKNLPDPQDIFDDETKTAIEQELPDVGFPADANQFVKFLRDAIVGREYSKFAFTRNLSLALEELAAFGERYSFDRESLSHISIYDVFEMTTGQSSTDPGKWLKSRAAEGRSRHELGQAIELPPLLTEERDFDAFELPTREPNFVTSKTARASIAELDKQEDTGIGGKIVFIPQADPGYDWLFGYDIAGLVTMYGGSNSHMAVRAAEFGLPAAIGVGETLYEQLVGANIVEINCEANTLKRIQ